MADSDLITGYVEALRSSLHWRSDVEDLVCEVDDHLRCAAFGLEAHGVDPGSAQREVLVRFGDAGLVARAFALTPTGGTAMPSRLTRTAGVFAIVAAALWLVAAPTAFITVGSEDDFEVRYMTWAVLVFAASACTTVAIFGMLRRAGGRGDAVTVIAMLVAILGSLLLGVATWAWIVGAPLLTIAVIVSVLRLRAARLANTVASILLVAAWPIGIAVVVILGILKVGPLDSYGDRQVAYLIGFATGSVLFAAALFVMGRWLRNEHAVDVADSMATA